MRGKKTDNPVESTSFKITVSVQSVALLDQLAKRGIYGRNRAEVAGRFVDAALQQFIDPPKLVLPLDEESK